jgi:hypothetical protein
MKLPIISNVQCLNISKFIEISIRMNNYGIIFFSSLYIYIYIYIFFFSQALQCLVLLSFLIYLCSEC